MDIKSARFVRSYSSIDTLPAGNMPEFAFIGRSNVGKSSCINTLCNISTLAKSGRTPGTTKLFNYFIINDAFHLVDLPGYGYARLSKSQREAWNQHLRRYLHERQQLVAVFLLVDGSIPIQRSDTNMILHVVRLDTPLVIVITKTDKASQKQLHLYQQQLTTFMIQHHLAEPLMIPFSSKTKKGRAALIDLINHLRKEYSTKPINNGFTLL